MLSITNVIMDELLGDDRTARAFRAKFPEEVLQESLAGQLWFGAECLAAGSSIMNREGESAAMRPLAKAVTKCLDNVRTLLREQCLRIKTPNATTLNLDVNDSFTETLCECLKIFDRLFAEFELLYVSAMVQVKSQEEHEMQELICVLFSETLQRALKIGHLSQDQVDYFDPALMFSIPRLAIVAGLVIYKKTGPLNMTMPADALSEMFRPFRMLLIKIQDLLLMLGPRELFQLEQLLCTNEDIQIQPQPQQQQSTKNNSNCDDVNRKTSSTVVDQVVVVCSNSNSNVINEYVGNNTDDSVNDGVYNDYASGMELPSTTTTTTTTMAKTTPPSTPTTEEDEDEMGGTAADGPSGFLIPNTNFGNLLQPHEAPLTHRFVASDDEYKESSVANNDPPSVFQPPDDRTMMAHRKRSSSKRDDDSGISTENTSLERTPDSDGTGNVVGGKYMGNMTMMDEVVSAVTTTTISINSDNQTTITISSPSSMTTSNTAIATKEDNPSTSQPDQQQQQRIRQRREKNWSRKSSSSSRNGEVDAGSGHSKSTSKHRKSSAKHHTVSGDDETSSSLSETDQQEVVLALRAVSRMKFK